MYFYILCSYIFFITSSIKERLIIENLKIMQCSWLYEEGPWLRSDEDGVVQGIVGEDWIELSDIGCYNCYDLVTKLCH